MGEILEIRKYPDRILCRKSHRIQRVTQREVKLFSDMLSTMQKACGIGLAAPQIGINQRLIVAAVGEEPVQLANPEVIEVKGKDKMEEGCLSVPGALVNVVRPYEVVVRGLSQKGNMVEVKARGFLARVLLHEIDHLNGKLIIDYMNLLNRIKFKLK